MEFEELFDSRHMIRLNDLSSLPWLRECVLSLEFPVLILGIPTSTFIAGEVAGLGLPLACLCAGTFSFVVRGELRLLS